jgi:hypothetical protein
VITPLDWAFFAIGVAATVPAWASVWVTYRRTPWHKTEIGRHLMVYMTALALTFTVLTVSTVLAYPRPLLFTAMQVLVYLLCVAAVWQRFAVVWQFRGPSPRHRGTTEPQTQHSAGEK